jgi:photosystem II stability/assembly factor-like uncharacterized protein
MTLLPSEYAALTTPLSRSLPQSLRQCPMQPLLIVVLTSAALAQPAPRILPSHTTESLRGVSAVSRKIAWASGTRGTYLRTTDGQTWQPAQVPGAESLDFRFVAAFSASEAFLMSAGPGDQSRIYYTADAGQHWQLQFTNPNPKGFFDSMVFWDRTHGIVLGDPIPDESGKLKFELLLTEDGQAWHQLPPANLPPAIEGEGAFAASNTCIAILPWNSKRKGTTSSRAAGAREDEMPSTPEGTGPDSNIWFGTGGKVARVFHSPDRGQTWQVTDTPILHGPDSAGIFSIAFRDATHGVIAGGDHKHPNQDGPNLAFTQDGGATWTLSKIHPQAYFSAAAYDRRTATRTGSRPRLFLVGQDFIFDLSPPASRTRLTPKKQSDLKFNALSPYPEGGAIIVGPKGTIATIP